MKVVVTLDPIDIKRIYRINGTNKITIECSGDLNFILDRFTLNYIRNEVDGLEEESHGSSEFSS